MVPIKHWENPPDVINDKLRQLPIVVFYYEAKELAIVIVHYISNFLFEGEGSQPPPFELCIILSDCQDKNIVVNLIRLVHIKWSRI